MKKIVGDVTEDAFCRIKDMVGDEDEQEDPVKNVNLVFSTQDRLEIYNQILGMLKAGEKHSDIAHQIIAMLNNHIADRMARAKGRAKGKSPIFRRIG